MVAVVGVAKLALRLRVGLGWSEVKAEIIIFVKLKIFTIESVQKIIFPENIIPVRKKN